MLASLRIKNLALVESLDWELDTGFHAITGETGAGKSIILGALKLVLGERAERGIIRAGSDQCVVEAIFHLQAESPVHVLLDAKGLESCEEDSLIIRRIVSSTGQGRQFVNGSACNLATLREIGDSLVDLHGPHDHQALFAREEQTRILDAFAGTRDVLIEYQKIRQEWMQLRQEQTELEQNEQELLREIDLLSHQVEEITSANIQTGEEEEVMARHKAAANAARIRTLVQEILGQTREGELSALGQLENCARLTRELTRLDQEATPFHEEFGSLVESLNRWSGALQDYAENAMDDPEETRRLEERLDVIQVLKRKYGPTIEEVLQFGEKATRRLEELTHREARRDSLDSVIQEKLKRMAALAATLTRQRDKAAAQLAKKITTNLKDLGFLKADLSIQLTHSDEYGVLGQELAEFVFAPNPGEPAQPLRSIASSGEISRVMLAIKSAVADQDRIPILVFDEIDANVGGEVAAMVGKKMHSLGGSHQVLCITHLPQVAAAATEQFVVAKEVNSGRTYSTLREVRGKERQEEIARMLGGVTPSALKHAASLMKGF